MRSISSLFAVFISLGGCTEETYVSPTGFTATEFSVETDPRAQYVMLDVTRHSDGRVLTLSRRSGSSGVTYTRRLIDCSRWQVVTIGSGATLAKMQRSMPDGILVPIVPEASADVTAQVGCQQIGMSRPS